MKRALSVLLTILMATVFSVGAAGASTDVLNGITTKPYAATLPQYTGEKTTLQVGDWVRFQIFRDNFDWRSAGGGKGDGQGVVFEDWMISYYSMEPYVNATPYFAQHRLVALEGELYYIAQAAEPVEAVNMVVTVLINDRQGPTEYFDFKIIPTDTTGPENPDPGDGNGGDPGPGDGGGPEPGDGGGSEPGDGGESEPGDGGGSEPGDGGGSEPGDGGGSEPGDGGGSEPGDGGGPEPGDGGGPEPGDGGEPGDGEGQGGGEMPGDGGGSSSEGDGSGAETPGQSKGTEGLSIAGWQGTNSLEQLLLTGGWTSLQTHVGMEHWLVVPAELFQWTDAAGADAKPDAKASVSLDQLTRAVGISVSREEAPQLVQEIGFAQRGGEACLYLRMAPRVLVLEDAPFSIALTMDCAGEGQDAVIAGTLGIDIAYVDGTEEANLKDSPVIEAIEDVRGATLFLGEGVYLAADLLSGRRYAGLAIRDWEGELPASYRLYTLGFDQENASVFLQGVGPGYVYSSAGIYLGTTEEQLPLLSEYLVTGTSPTAGKGSSTGGASGGSGGNITIYKRSLGEAIVSDFIIGDNAENGRTAGRGAAEEHAAQKSINGTDNPNTGAQ